MSLLNRRFPRFARFARDWDRMNILIVMALLVFVVIMSLRRYFGWD